MDLLFLFSAWAFGPDVHALGSPEFHQRHAAHRRLAAAGWLAYPALLSGLTSPVPERAARCETLIDGLESPVRLLLEVEGMARGTLPIPDDTPEAVLAAVCRRVDHLGGWRTPNAWQWAKTPAHHRGTVAGDCEYVARFAAAQRVAPAVAGTGFTAGR